MEWTSWGHLEEFDVRKPGEVKSAFANLSEQNENPDAKDKNEL